MTTSKEILRTKALAARQKIDRDEANAAALALAEHLLNAISASARVVAGYRSIRGEIDVAGAFPELALQGYALCLPVIETENAPLVFRSWQPGEALTTGKFDVEVPADGSVVVPDTVIVPLAAFDRKGHRLGYGVGYYDRTIAALRAKNKNLRVLGAAFASQQLDAIPADKHDEKLDMIVTERGVLKIL